MPYQATVYRVLVASPSDMVDERKAIPEIVQQWNRDNALSAKTVLDPVKWETHSTPEMGDRPQEIVNRQIVRGCDILVGVFWTRLGSHTGKEDSGTVEEIREFVAAGRPVLLYFSRVPVTPDSVNAEQWAKLKTFKEECQAKGLVSSYESIEELRDLLRSHLGRTLQRLQDAGGGAQAAAPRSIPEPEERDAHREAILSFSSDFGVFLRKTVSAWEAERDSQPLALDDAKFLLRRVADELIEYRSRVIGEEGQLSDLLAEATKQLKSLQRHDVFLDGGVSYRKFWQRGDETLFLLEIVPTLLDDALRDEKTRHDRESSTRAAIEEIEFNRQHLMPQEYSSATIVRTAGIDELLGENPKLPGRLLRTLRAYTRNLQAARDVHRVTVGTAADYTPELIKIEGLLSSAQAAGQEAIPHLQLLLQYRRQEAPGSAAGA